LQEIEATRSHPQKPRHASLSVLCAQYSLANSTARFAIPTKSLGGNFAKHVIIRTSHATRRSAYIFC
jgi:hypothetical protein